MKHLDGLSVLVLGLGDSGLAMARWCAQAGAQVRVWDSREAPPRAAALAEHVPTASRLQGKLDDSALDGVQLVLQSPGLAPHDARLAALRRAAAARGVPLQGELSLFARALADLQAERGYAPKVIAITGTNGKTTTAAMTAQLVESTGRRVALAGNIGPTMLQTLADALALETDAEAAAPVAAIEEAAPHASAQAVLEDVPESPQNAALDDVDDDVDDGAEDDVASSGGPPPHLIPPPPPGPVFSHLPEVWVLELSSFQLDGVDGFEPSAAVLLNLSEDHLDWHGDMAAYAQAKARVYGQHAVMVVNRDDAAVEPLLAPLLQLPPAASKAAARARPRREVVRFSVASPPRAPGDWGLLSDHGMAWLARALPLDGPPARAKRGAGPLVEAQALIIQRLMPADALRLRGRHNVANALAALALAQAIGCPVAPMLHALRDYAGEPHRVQRVGCTGGVDAIDDSKGTNVGATVAALTGLGADRAPQRLVAILGGDGKGQNFAPLAEPVRRYARAVATLGRDAERIEAALAATGVPLQRHASLQAATRWAFAQAQVGDAVLLSPACASLDMFDNYAHRAQVFVAEVLALAAECGEVLA